MIQEKKESPSKTTLHENLASTRILDNSYQSSNLLNNCTLDGGHPPLHSHSPHLSQDNSFNTSFRLLNPNSRLECKPKSSHTLDSFIKKPAFGCSSPREVEIFKGEKQHDNKNSLDISTLNRTFIHKKVKTEEIDQLDEQAEMKKIISSFKSPTNNNHRLGFGISSELERVATLDLSDKRRSSPGPGAYSSDDDEIIKLGKRKAFSKIHFENIRKIENSPGPGSYSIPSFTASKETFEKEVWKTKFMERKNKTRLVFEKIVPEKKEIEAVNEFKNSQNIRKVESEEKENFSKNKIYERVRIQKKKLIREELREKTNSFLPKCQETQFSTYYRGPTYKYMMSNCFIPKNDHPFQAHYYKQADPEGEYMFFKGKASKKKGEIVSYFFKSASNREAF